MTKDNKSYADLKVQIKEFEDVLEAKQKVNLSIYLFDCIAKPINQLFFKINPMFEYPR